MNAPNPTQKCTLKSSKSMHSRRPWSNIPGSVPQITPTAPRCLISYPLPTLIFAPQQSPRMANPNIAPANPNVIPAPTWIPHVSFVPVKGGLHNRNFISQEAINFLTKCVWVNLPDICTLTKLKTKSAPSCLHFVQVAMPMIHSKTGKSISSHKQLMHNPAMSEVWQTAFGKDFGGMVQGNNKMGQKCTNSIFVTTHNEVKCIPKNQTVTYACIVVNFCPQKADPHHIQIMAGGNLINYPSELSTCTADLTPSKLMWNSVLSTEGAKYMCLDI
jgi:hypothetical protein